MFSKSKQLPIPPKPKSPSRKNVEKVKLDKNAGWISDQVNQIQNASNFNEDLSRFDFYTNPQKKIYADDISKKINFNKGKNYEIFLYYWLGVDCETGADEQCNTNLDKFQNVSKIFGKHFIPFYGALTPNEKRKNDIIETIKSPSDFMITLSSSQSGAFLAAYVDPKTGNRKLERIEKDSQLENIIQIFNSRIKQQNQTKRLENLCQKIKELNIEDITVLEKWLNIE